MCRFLQSCEQSLPELTHLSLSFVIKSYPPSHFTEPIIQYYTILYNTIPQIQYFSLGAILLHQFKILEFIVPSFR